MPGWKRCSCFALCGRFFWAGAWPSALAVSIDLVAARLNPNARRILDLFCYIVTIIVLIYLTVGGVGLAESVTKKVTPYFKIKYSYIDIAGPIGCVLMMIQYTFIIVREFFHRNTDEKGAEA